MTDVLPVGERRQLAPPIVDTGVLGCVARRACRSLSRAWASSTDTCPNNGAANAQSNTAGMIRMARVPACKVCRR